MVSKVVSMAEHTGDSTRWDARQCASEVLKDIAGGMKIKHMIVTAFEELEDGRLQQITYYANLTNVEAVAFLNVALRKAMDEWGE